MNKIDEGFLPEYESIFRNMEAAWRGSDSAAPIDATEAQYEGFDEIVTVVTCGFGMVADVMRTSAAAIALTKMGFGGEVGPLVRLVFEEAMAVNALVKHGFAAVEAFGRAHAGNLRRLQSISVPGLNVIGPVESTWIDEFRQAAANTEAGTADNGIKISSIGNGGDEAMAMLYYGWLRTTQTSHAGLMSSRRFVRRANKRDGSIRIQRMFISDYEFADCRITLLPAVEEALRGYTNLGPTNLVAALPSISKSLDDLHDRHLASREGAKL